MLGINVGPDVGLVLGKDVGPEVGVEVGVDVGEAVGSKVGLVLGHLSKCRNETAPEPERQIFMIMTSS
jgi:hypothetical protein